METQLEGRDKNSGSDLGGSLIDSVLSPTVMELAPSLTDVLLSQLTDEELLGQVPVFQTFYNVYKGAITIQNHLFLRKIAFFLRDSEKKHPDERTKFEKELEMDHKLRTKVGENLLLILERIDHFEKASVLAKVFAGRLREDIDEDTFYKLGTAINNASITDLRTLEQAYTKIASYDPKAGKLFSDTLDNATAQSLFSVGLVGEDGYMETTYTANKLGSCLLRLLKHG